MRKHEPEITFEERQQADWMIHELQNQMLHVILIPAPEQMFTGHMIRVADQRNPEWYRGQGLNRKECYISLNRIRFGLPLSSNMDYKMYELVRHELRRL